MIGSFRENSIELTNLELKLKNKCNSQIPKSLVEFTKWLNAYVHENRLTDQEKQEIEKNQVDIWIHLCVATDKRDL